MNGSQFQCPVPSGPSFSQVKCSLAPICSITSTQTAQNGKLLKPWERKAEGRTAVSSLYFTLTACAAFAHRCNWHSGHSAYRYDSATSWQLLIRSGALSHTTSLPGFFSSLGVKKRREASGSTVKWGYIVQCSGNLRLCPSMTLRTRYFTQRDNPLMTLWASPLSSLFSHSHRHFEIWLSWFNVFNLKWLFEFPLTWHLLFQGHI